MRGGGGRVLLSLAPRGRMMRRGCRGGSHGATFPGPGMRVVCMGWTQFALLLAWGMETGFCRRVGETGVGVTLIWARLQGVALVV